MKIPFGRPFIDDADREAVCKVLAGSWILNGPAVREFETRFGEYVDRSCVAVNSCTAGMHAALHAAGVGPGDEVVMPALSFAANGAPVINVGAVPVFVDVSPDTWTLDPAQLEAARTDRTRAVLLVHYAGLCADMQPVLDWADGHGIVVIEDAAHALGALYHDRLVGSFGHITVFSFGPLKHLTTAGMGGMVVSSDPAILQSVRKFSSYGMDKSMWDRREDQKPWQYGVPDMGLNYRMTDVAGAMGCTQMDKLDSILDSRRTLAEGYNEILTSCPGVTPQAIPEGFEHSYLYYVVAVDAEKNGRSRDQVAKGLIEAGIGCSVHWDPPLHLHTLYARFGFREGRFPVTEALTQKLISLPLFVGMTSEELESTCAVAGWLHA